MKRQLTPEQIAHQQEGSTRLAPGFWQDRDGGLHVSIPELLAAVGLDDTPANRQQVHAMVKELLGEALPDAEVIEQE